MGRPPNHTGKGWPGQLQAYDLVNCFMASYLPLLPDAPMVREEAQPVPCTFPGLQEAPLGFQAAQSQIAILRVI